jgi:hypothetical protein
MNRLKFLPEAVVLSPTATSNQPTMPGWEWRRGGLSQARPKNSAKTAKFLFLQPLTRFSLTAVHSLSPALTAKTASNLVTTSNKLCFRRQPKNGLVSGVPVARKYAKNGNRFWFQLKRLSHCG